MDINTALNLAYLTAGLVLLWKSADFLVTGGVGLAERLGISPLVIGLTIIAMGTSAPEVAASIAAVLRGPEGGDVAIGNVFGSNIANLALVGGLIALIRPLRVKRQTVLRELPAMIIVALLLLPAIYDSQISRLDAVVLLTVFTALAITTVRIARREGLARKVDIEASISLHDEVYPPHTITKSLILVLIGLIGLAFGARMTVTGATFIGGKLGLTGGVIGLTMIAFGTSLPELVTCVVATVKGHHDISVGNLVGSNIFNTLLVTGAAGAVRPFMISDRFAGGPDYWIMMAAGTAFAAAIIAGRHTIGRITGSALLLGYVAYIVYLFAYS